MEDINLNRSLDLPPGGPTGDDVMTGYDYENQNNSLTTVKEVIPLPSLVNGIQEASLETDETEIKTQYIREDDAVTISSDHKQSQDGRDWTKFDEINHDETEVKVVEPAIRNNQEQYEHANEPHVKYVEEQYSNGSIIDHIERSNWVNFEPSDMSDPLGGVTEMPGSESGAVERSVHGEIQGGRDWTKFDELNLDETEVKVVESASRNNQERDEHDSETHVKYIEEQPSNGAIIDHIERSGSGSSGGVERCLQGKYITDDNGGALNEVGSLDDSLPSYSALPMHLRIGPEGLSHTEPKCTSSQPALRVSQSTVTPKRLVSILKLTPEVPVPTMLHSLERPTPPGSLSEAGGTLHAGRDGGTANDTGSGVGSLPPNYTRVTLSDEERNEDYWTVIRADQRSDAVEMLGSRDTGALIDEEEEYERCGAPKWAIFVATLLTACIIISVIVVLVYYIRKDV